MKKIILTSALVMLCLFANAQSIQVKDLAGSVGSWKGNLTYLDYSSGKPFTMLANIKISLTADSRGYIMAYEYPKEPHANAKDTTAIVSAFFGKDKIVQFKRDSAQGFTLVTEVDGVDGNENKKAILRHQYLLQKNTFTITKSVKFQGTDSWIKRNEYLLTRAEIKPEISFSNDYKDVYHLSLIIYTPDGKIQTRVSNLNPAQIKSYSLPVNTEIFIADWKQEAFAMKGNDIKATGVKPYLIVKESDANRVIKLSSIVPKVEKVNAEDFKPVERYHTPDLIVTQISENAFVHVSQLKTNDFGKVDCNGLIVRNSNEAIVFDTPTNNKSAEELIDFVEQKLHSKIKAVIPTHFHADCLGGLESFHLHKIPSYSNNKTIELGTINKVTLPQNGFNDSLQLKVGNAVVLVQFLGEGHTKDNVVGYFPSEAILFGGCLIKEKQATKGYVGDANIAQWSATVEKVKQHFPQVKKVIPGHGQIGGIDLLDYTIALFRQAN